MFDSPGRLNLFMKGVWIPSTNSPYAYMFWRPVGICVSGKHHEYIFPLIPPQLALEPHLYCINMLDVVVQTIYKRKLKMHGPLTYKLSCESMSSPFRFKGNYHENRLVRQSFSH